MNTIWRQSFGADYQRQKWPVMGRSHSYQHAERAIWHSHEQGQLVCTVAGLVRILTPVGAWLVPPGQALWLAPGTDHELHMVGQVSLCYLYVEPNAAPWLWRECRLLAVTPLLQELLVTMGDEPYDYAPESTAALAAPLVLDCLRKAPKVDYGRLPLPEDKRLLQICEVLLTDPANNASLDTLGHEVAASARTIARLFKAETGLTFGQWRQHAKLAEAICQLSLGQSVARVARNLGYANANAFSAMFQRELAKPPTSYVREMFGGNR